MRKTPLQLSHSGLKPSTRQAEPPARGARPQVRTRAREAHPAPTAAPHTLQSLSPEIGTLAALLRRRGQDLSAAIGNYLCRRDREAVGGAGSVDALVTLPIGGQRIAKMQAGLMNAPNTAWAYSITASGTATEAEAQIRGAGSAVLPYARSGENVKI